jgi:hypothetical protein
LDKDTTTFAEPLDETMKFYQVKVKNPVGDSVKSKKETQERLVKK